MNNENKVNFDPGFAAFSVRFPAEIPVLLDEIAKLKKHHQKKFEFQKLEMQVVPLVKNCAAIYLGCILWGSYLYYQYKNDSREIQGNLIKEMPEDQKNSINYSTEIDMILQIIDKIDKASIFYLKRPSLVIKKLIPYFEIYKEFARLNNGFKELSNTSEIKLPENVAHFENYDNQKLDELKNKINEIINSKKIEKILELGFYGSVYK